MAPSQQAEGADVVHGVTSQNGHMESVAVSLEGDPNGGLPKIEMNNRQLREKRRDTIAAIKTMNMANPQEPRLFHGDTGLTYIAQDKFGLPLLKTASRELIQDVMADAASWISTTHVQGKNGWVPIVKQVTPPRDLAENYMVQSRWPGVPPIDGIATAPIVARGRSNVKICSSRGYHAAARRYIALPKGFELPDTNPSPENMATAKALIFHTLMGEVAFSDQSSRCHAFVLMLLPFVRTLIDGPTPMHLIDAPTQASGKSHAAKICISPFAVPSASVMKGENEEWRKSIMAALIAGRSHIFYDNIKGELSSPALAAALTEPSLTERNMGGLGEVTARVNCTWVGTSNNAKLDGDTASRCVVIRLDTGMENPEQRVFSFEPLEYIRDNRAQVCGAIITLIRCWLDRGMPAYSGKHQCRFSAWQQVMGGLAEACEIEGFLDNWVRWRNQLDPEKAAWAEFCKAWHERFGATFRPAAELLPLALEIPEIAGTLGDKEGRGQTQRLGRQLQVRRDKMFGDLKILSGIVTRNGATYAVAEKDEAENLPSAGLF